jgi:hypothetical protein
MLHVSIGYHGPIPWHLCQRPLYLVGWNVLRTRDVSAAKGLLPANVNDSGGIAPRQLCVQLLRRYQLIHDASFPPTTLLQ